VNSEQYDDVSDTTKAQVSNAASTMQGILR